MLRVRIGGADYSNYSSDMLLPILDNMTNADALKYLLCCHSESSRWESNCPVDMWKDGQSVGELNCLLCLLCTM